MAKASVAWPEGQLAWPGVWITGWSSGAAVIGRGRLKCILRRISIGPTIRRSAATSSTVRRIASPSR